MAGQHFYAVRGEHDAPTLIRSLYGLDAGVPVEPIEPGGVRPAAAVAGVAPIGAWTVLVGSFPADLGGDGELARLAAVSRGGELFRWANEDVTGSVGLDRFVNGEHVRGFWSVEGEVVASSGAPLEGEPEGGLEGVEPHGLDEWVVFSVVEGYVCPWEAITSADFQMYRGG